MNISNLGEYFSFGWIFLIWVNISHPGEYFSCGWIFRKFSCDSCWQKGPAVTIYPKKPAACWFYFDNYISTNYHTSVSYDLYKFPLQKQSMPEAGFTLVKWSFCKHSSRNLTKQLEETGWNYWTCFQNLSISEFDFLRQAICDIEIAGCAILRWFLFLRNLEF